MWVTTDDSRDIYLVTGGREDELAAKTNVVYVQYVRSSQPFRLVPENTFNIRKILFLKLVHR